MTAPPPRPNSESIELPAFRQLVGRTLGGRYRVVAPLGRGGAGQVFTAVQDPLGREVAVKVLRTDLGDESTSELEARFQREAALLSRLRHPNLVAVHDFGTEGELRYVVMEKLHGSTLRQELRERGPLEGRFAARIGAEIARGLRHAHQAGLVHRDVKPNNVLLESDDDGVLHAKLIDFGLVKDTGEGEEASSITRVGAYLGTPAYMAPEQARGEANIGTRADVYALGVTLYQLLCGKLPFEAETALGLAVMHSTEPYPPMALRAPDVPVDPELEAIVRACLAKEPGARPDMAEVALGLERWLSKGPAQTPSSPAPRGAVPLVAGSMAVAAASLVFAAGVAFVAVGWALWPAGAPTVPVEVVAPAPPPDPTPSPVEVAPTPTPTVGAPAVGAPEPAPGAPAAEAPAPEPPAVPTPAPGAAEPKPRSKPSPRPTGPPVVADGVAFDPAHAARAVAWLNSADQAALYGAGIAPRQAGVILSSRPFATLPAFAATPQIGEKTVQSVFAATAQK